MSLATPSAAGREIEVIGLSKLMDAYGDDSRDVEKAVYNLCDSGYFGCHFDTYLIVEDKEAGGAEVFRACRRSETEKLIVTNETKRTLAQNPSQLDIAQQMDDFKVALEGAKGPAQRRAALRMLFAIAGLPDSFYEQAPKVVEPLLRDALREASKEPEASKVGSGPSSKRQGPGRPRSAIPAGEKPASLSLRITESEMAALKRGAAKSGKSVSEYAKNFIDFNDMEP